MKKYCKGSPKKLKSIISIFTLLLIVLTNVSGQDIDLTYKVTNYEINGENYDQLALKGDVALSFYKCTNGSLCFANQWRAFDSQSYGGVHSFMKREIPETKTTYPGVEIKFTWEYFNTYDSDRGTAAVTITHFLVSETWKFKAEIVLMETNDVLKFKGFLE